MLIAHSLLEYEKGLCGPGAEQWGLNEEVMQFVIYYKPTGKKLSKLDTQGLNANATILNFGI